MNTIKYFSLFLSILLIGIENTPLFCMEDSSNNQSQMGTTSDTKKSKKKKKGRKKSKKRTASVKTEETALVSKEPSLYCNATTLEELHKSLKDLPATLEQSELTTRTEKETYLHKLHILTNILVLLDTLSAQLEKIFKLDTIALGTVHKLHAIKSFVYSDNATRIDDNTDGCVVSDINKRKILFPDLYFLESSEAKAATIQASKISRSSCFDKKNIGKLLPREHQKLTQFLKLLLNVVAAQ